MKTVEFYIQELETTTDWLEEHIGKLAEVKVRQFDLLKAVELRKADLMVSANELDENNKPKLKNAELRDAFVLNSIFGTSESHDLQDLQKQAIVEEALIRTSEFQFKALIAILALMNNNKEGQ
jgi:hypothetical protein